MPSNSTSSHPRSSPADATGSKCWACFQPLPPDRKNTHPPSPPSNIFLFHRKRALFSKVVFAPASLQACPSPSSSFARRYDGLWGQSIGFAPNLIHGVMHA